MSLEDEFWSGLRQMAHDHHLNMYQMIETINANRTSRNLSSRLRLAVLRYQSERAGSFNDLL